MMLTVSQLAVEVPVLAPSATVAMCDELFRRSEHLTSLIVHGDGVTHVVDRERFLNRLTGPLGYGRALYLHRSIIGFEVAVGEVLPGNLRVSKAATLASARVQNGDFADLVVEVNGRLRVVPIAALFHQVSVELGRENRTDPLTRLANRRHLDAVLAELDGEPGALALLDLDGFKLVNDALGHQAGDQLLQLVARRLENASADAVVARLGGDEFALYLPGSVDLPEVSGVLERVIRTVAMPVTLGPLRMHVTVSIGVALRDGPIESDELMRMADAALYAAKADGKNCYRFYDDSHTSSARRRLQLAHELRSAIEDDHIRIAVQPVFDLLTGAPAGSEVLARWRHRELGEISPAEFIPVAETSGMMAALGRAVRERAALWITRHGHREGRIALNLSRQELLLPDLVSSLDQLLSVHEIPSHLLSVEITETAAVADPERIVRALHDIRSMGITISLDDFGAGVTSIANLRQLPLDNVKFDRSLVAPLLLPGIERIRAERTVSSLVDLCHGLDLTVTAEGIEDERQLEVLRDARVDYGQGWLLARPVHESLDRPVDRLSTRPNGDQRLPAPK